MIKQLRINTPRQGLLNISPAVSKIVQNSNTDEGLCTVFVQHTSASLIIQENADPSAKKDLEHWLNRLVKENDPLYTHTSEGPDDMPAHIKSALTASSIGIPIIEGQLALGIWQGLYLWEHRRNGAQRNVIVHIA